MELVFLGLMIPDESIPHMSEDHGLWAIDDGNHVMVSTLSEMISTIAPMIRASGHVLKPQGANEKLDPQHREV